RQIARQAQHRRGVQKIWPVPYDHLKLLPRLEYPSCFEQQTPELIPQIVEPGSQGQGGLILVDPLREPPRLDVGIPQAGVVVRKLGGDVSGEPPLRIRAELPGPAEGGVRLVLAAQVVEYQGAVDERFHVSGIQLQGLVQLLERLLVLPDQRI